MPEPSPSIEAHSAERGVNVIEDNEAQDDSRQFLNCAPADLIFAKRNVAAKKALQCIGPMSSETVELLSRDFSQNSEASIDRRQVDSTTQFRGTGRTLHAIGGASGSEGRG